MSSELQIYKTLPDRSVLALRLMLDDSSGKVDVLPGESYADQARQLLDNLMLFDPGPPPRGFTRDDGMEYLTAVHRALMRSSAWHTRTV